MPSQPHKQIHSKLDSIIEKQQEHGESLARIDQHLEHLNGTVHSNCDDIEYLKLTQSRWKGITVGMVATLSVITTIIGALVVFM